MDFSRNNRMGTGMTVEGVVSDALPHNMFAITLDNGQKVVGHISGVVGNLALRVNPGDRVTVELSPYDLSRGRITRRHK
jgi:translation initiation factor IF-1